MRKFLAKGLVIIIEAGLLVLADLIMKRSKRNGNFPGLHRGYSGGDAVALRYPRAAHSSHAWRGLIRVPKRGRSKS
ncbi:MAG: hypothetical protein ACLP5H_03545 [Desulfomonilaceae bacterium]